MSGSPSLLTAICLLVESHYTTHDVINFPQSEFIDRHPFSLLRTNIINDEIKLIKNVPFIRYQNRLINFLFTNNAIKL